MPPTGGELQEARTRRQIPHERDLNELQQLQIPLIHVSDFPTFFVLHIDTAGARSFLTVCQTCSVPGLIKLTSEPSLRSNGKAPGSISGAYTERD